MSFYDDASWLLIPSGIKEDVVYAQKPISGLGDLTFTRASDATYTDSTGVVRRSPYNLVTFSEMFTDASWAKTGDTASTVSANTTTAPNGTLTADTFIPGVLGNAPSNLSTGSNRIFRDVDTGTAGSFTLSIWVKTESVNTAFTLYRARRGSDVVVAQVNGTTTSEWQRIVVSGSDSVSGARFVFASSQRCYIWGAQLVEGTSALDYFPTTDRLNVPRIDFRNADGTLSSCGRLLLEPQRTNSIRNSSMVGAVTGTPGTLPTNWGISAAAGLTQTVVGTGTENGLPYIDLRLSGTATATAYVYRLETTTSISAANGQTWTYAIYAKSISGTIADPRLVIFERTSAGGSVIDGNQAYTPTSVLQRFAFTRTLSGGATVAAVMPGLYFFLTIGQSYDFTIRIAAPQMELGAYATTWVPTTTAAVTRLADDAIKSGISSLIGQTEGTIFADIRYEVAQTAGISIADGSGPGTNWIFFRFPNATTDSRVYISASGVVISQIINNVFVANQTYKIALGYKSGDWALYVNGTSIASGTNTFTFNAAFNRIILNAVGSAQAGAAVYAKYNQAALFPTRLTNDQLEVLTSEGYGTYALLAQSLNCVLQ